MSAEAPLRRGGVREIPPRRVSRARRLRLAAEFVLLYVAFPLSLWFERAAFGRMIIPSLLVLATVFVVILVRDPDFDRRRLGGTRDFGRGLRRILGVLLPTALLLTFVTWWARPELFLRLPLEEPRLWTIVMLAYPLLSVYPQEIIFRTFLFHRYAALFGTERALVAASALGFGLAHLFFANWIAPVLSAAGGWLFARTYARTGSTLQASVEHGLWGNVIFTIGLGWYFYGGAIGAH